uniref:Uncharacterized protein n=1 Tax=Anguilla anguilla TaxID=7936 RepID=A0A0E9P767_ANGAN
MSCCVLSSLFGNSSCLRISDWFHCLLPQCQWITDISRVKCRVCCCCQHVWTYSRSRTSLEREQMVF